MGRKKNTVIRRFYTYDPETRKSKCRKCAKLLSGSFLTNLRKHFMYFHNETYEKLMNEETEDEEDEIETPMKMKKIQIEMNEAIITDCCVNLVTKEGRPFTLLDSKAFRVIVEPIFKGLNVGIINSHNITDIIATKTAYIKKQIEKLCTGKVMSLKIDLATCLNRSVMGVNIQFIHSKKVIIKTLGIIQLNDRHTAEILKTEILHLLQQYNIDVNQIYNVTTDNGSNLIKAVDLLREDCSSDILQENENENETFTQSLDAIHFDCFGTVRCAAHTLQLAVNEVLRKDDVVQNVIKNARNICKILRTPTYIHLVSNMGFIKPVIDVPTRWNSTITMLEILLKYKTFCLQNERKHPKLKMSDEDWKTVLEIIDTFLPIKEMTVKLQNSQLLLGDFCKHFMTLKLILDKQKGCLARKLELAVKSREPALLNTTTATTAIFLDSRISRCLNSKQKHLARNHLKKVISKILQVKRNVKCLEDDALVSPPSDSISDCIPPMSSSSNSLLSSFDLSTSGNSSTQSVHDTELRISSTSDKLLENYLQEIGTDESDSDVEDIELFAAFRNIDEYKPKLISLESNLLDYWEEMKYKFPHLYKAAKVIHGVPATQVSVERAFSTLKFILNDNRYNLSPTNLENVLLVKLN